MLVPSTGGSTAPARQGEPGEPGLCAHHRASFVMLVTRCKRRKDFGLNLIPLAGQEPNRNIGATRVE